MGRIVKTILFILIYHGLVLACLSIVCYESCWRMILIPISGYLLSLSEKSIYTHCVKEDISIQIRNSKIGNFVAYLKPLLRLLIIIDQVQISFLVWRSSPIFYVPRFLLVIVWIPMLSFLSSLIVLVLLYLICVYTLTFKWDTQQSSTYN